VQVAWRGIQQEFRDVPSWSIGDRSKPLATNVRWRIMGLVTLITILTYLDRLNLSIAGKSIQDEFLLSNQTMGWILSAFLLGYALLQIPGGWAGDRFGPRNVLTVAILCWSVFTAMTALAPALLIARWFGVVTSFLVVRFLVGVGEAASSPNNNKIVAAWIGSVHRGVGSSFTILGIGVAGALTPPLISWTMQRYGWRSTFYAAGLFGIVVAFLWHWYVTDIPEEHPSVNSAELALISGMRKSKSLNSIAKGAQPPWGKLFRSRSIWGLTLGYLCQGYPIYFYHTWFFIYLVRTRHLTVEQSGFWGTTPYLAIAILAPLGGIYSDGACRRFGKSLGRKITVWTGMFLSAILLWIGSDTKDSNIAILLLAIGGGFNMFAAVAYWATCIDLSEKFTGSISGLMNTFGNMGGWLSPIITAYIATRGGWNHALACAAAVTLASGVLFSLVDASRSLDDDEVT
jgi:ACS family glucarate transporter-like MFS transporter